MDSIKNRMAIIGIKRVVAIFWCLNRSTDSLISTINQDRLRRGTNTKRDRRVLIPAFVWLNPQSKSRVPPTNKIIVAWVKKIATPLKKFSFSSYANYLFFRMHTSHLYHIG
jgi:hypothetical protein